MKISIATEDILTEEVMVKILSSVSDVDIPFKSGKKGCGYLKKNIHKFNKLSYRHNVLVVFGSDLQTNINEFRSSIEKEIKNKSRSLDIIIPVREIESRDIDRAKVHSPSLHTALMTISHIVSQVDS